MAKRALLQQKRQRYVLNGDVSYSYSDGRVLQPSAGSPGQFLGHVNHTAGL